MTLTVQPSLFFAIWHPLSFVFSDIILHWWIFLKKYNGWVKSDYLRHEKLKRERYFEKNHFLSESKLWFHIPMAVFFYGHGDFFCLLSFIKKTLTI
jgi:hypothetical protein